MTTPLERVAGAIRNQYGLRVRTSLKLAAIAIEALRVPEKTWKDAPTDEEFEELVGGGRVVPVEAWAFGYKQALDDVFGKEES